MTEQTKTITFEGKQYSFCPLWVNWVARNADGCVYGYEKEPYMTYRGSWEEDSGGDVVLIVGVRNNWNKSLISI